MSSRTTYDDHFAPVTGPAAAAVRTGAGLATQLGQETEPPSETGAQPAPVEAALPEPATATALPRPVFIGERERERRIVLDWPLSFEGRDYVAITVRRPTAGEIGRFNEQLLVEAAIDPNARVHFPIFYDDEGEPVPPVVLDMLDGDDDETVMTAARDFLPRRLRRMAEA